MVVIDNLSENVSRTLDKFFNKLRITGYESECSVNNILLYVFLEDFLDTFKNCISEDDYASIIKVLNCLHGSCLISYPQYLNQKDTSSVFYSICGKS